ncbi:MAG: hypothetical protein AAFY42_10900 [Pseudomonadota bacterium]
MTLSKMPAQMIAGDSLGLSIPIGDYTAADGWAVRLTLTPLAGGTPQAFDASETVGGIGQIAISSAASSALQVGDHRYLIAATKDGDRASLDFGTVHVLPDPAADGVDQRSAAKRALDAIDAVLENRAGSEDVEYTFEDGRSIKKVPHGELLMVRKHYARIVAREKTKGRGPRRVSVRL